MKLTRKQELALIDIGLEIHLDKTLFKHKTIKRKKKIGKKWTSEQRRKFLNTMRIKWNKKRKEVA